MPETPRTYTLRKGRYRQIEVVEKALVDVERERLLDLVERLTANLAALESQRSGLPGLDVVADAKARIREYGRLGEEES